MGSLLTELKRRNVLRVGAAYLVVGWVVVQITDIAVPALRLPDRVPTLVFYLGLTGLPFALLFTWASEPTPESVKKTAEADELRAGKSSGQKLNCLTGTALVAALGFIAYQNMGSDDATPPNEGVEFVGRAATRLILSARDAIMAGRSSQAGYY